VASAEAKQVGISLLHWRGTRPTYRYVLD